MILQPSNQNTHDIYIDIKAGSLKEISQQITQQLSATGSALMLSDVLSALIFDTQYYAGWAVLECQRLATSSFILDENVILNASEWAIIYPVISAHCNLLQAKLTEGSRSLGGDGFGLTESEARAIYSEARLTMQNEAFVEPPLTFKSLNE